MILYNRLWETMKTKEISQYRLIKYYNFSAGQIGRLKKNDYVSTHTIDVLCSILGCNVEDIMEFRPDTAALRSEDGASAPADLSEGSVCDQSNTRTISSADEKSDSKDKSCNDIQKKP